MILRHIAKVSFRKSEHTNARALAGAMRLHKMGRDEVLCLVSLGGDQIVFVYYDFRGAVTHSERLRRNSSEKWTPDMLAEYAKAAKLDITNLKLFDQWHGKKINTQTKRS